MTQSESQVEIDTTIEDMGSGESFSIGDICQHFGEGPTRAFLAQYRAKEAVAAERIRNCPPIDAVQFMRRAVWTQKAEEAFAAMSDAEIAAFAESHSAPPDEVMAMRQRIRQRLQISSPSGVNDSTGLPS